MRHDSGLDAAFERFLPSASGEEIEAARWRVLDRVRANIAAIGKTVEGNLALNRGEYHILLALENGARHAYAIMSEVEELTEGATRFGPGTLFTSISRLLTNGWIEETGMRPDPRINDEQRQYYRLTGTGQRVLASESARLAGQLNAQEMVRSL
jgi:DNA-binding PadR family transcriptional regulator